jgi:hypothetical protein
MTFSSWDSQCLVLIENGRVFIIIHRVIRFRAFHPFLRVLVRNHRFGLGTELEMLMFNDAGVRSFAVGIIHHSISLIVFLIQQLIIETKATVFELAKLKIKILVDRAV